MSARPLTLRKGEALPGMRFWRLSASSGERQYQRLSESYPEPEDGFVWHVDTDDDVTVMALLVVLRRRPGCHWAMFRFELSEDVDWDLPEYRGMVLEDEEIVWWIDHLPTKADVYTRSGDARFHGSMAAALIAALEAT